ncbi:cold shock domain-containing protein [Chitinophaga qingshengii]|uniref:Cold shock domain-containing protein n=1 Tax=Chitinophaga qingshengii TaxID=1569794 RepID=A0ABR7TIZ8_9BACT|nr:cold shock domain-containing protein [Chitinophaga qingshengii]MBC9929384.1 cold shock domain-containing protein [Chitinophaga qingshengii]
MGESFSKKENRNKKAKAKENKAQRTQERKLNNNKGKGLEDMLAYVDENGNLSASPPRETKRAEIEAKDIQIGATPRPAEDPVRTGTVSFFNHSKGFGFIVDDKSGEDIFFHMNDLLEAVREKDKVTFLRDRNAKGYFAASVKKAGPKP